MAYASEGDLERIENALDSIDGAKRATLRKLIVGSAYLVPLVMSFAIDGLTAAPAMAESNQTCSTTGSDDPNHQSSLSSTTEGGNVSCESSFTITSDRRLKRDIQLVSVLENGLRLYAYRYLGDERKFVGVMAQDLLADERYSHAVVERGGYFAVDYHALGLTVTDPDGMRAAGNRALAFAS